MINFDSLIDTLNDTKVICISFNVFISLFEFFGVFSKTLRIVPYCYIFTCIITYIMLFKWHKYAFLCVLSRDKFIFESLPRNFLNY